MDYGLDVNAHGDEYKLGGGDQGEDECARREHRDDARDRGQAEHGAKKGWRMRVRVRAASGYITNGTVSGIQWPRSTGSRL